jgi:hypothetical protein
MHPHSVKQPSLTRTIPLIDMPTGLMAAAVTRKELARTEIARPLQPAARRP